MQVDPSAWIDVGAADELAARPLQQVLLGRKKIALVCKDGQFSAISGVCNHVGGPLGEGKLDGDYVVCPWHYWKFHCRTGEGEPGYEATVFRRTTCASRTGACWSIRRRARSEAASLTRRIHWRVRRSASRARSACWVSRPRR